MAHHHSAIRQERRSLRHQAINKKNKSATRTQIKKLKELIASKDKETAKTLLPEVFSTIDKSAKKGTIHKNKAARSKSRLNRQVEALNTAPAR